jgi:trigger factor
MLLRDRVIKEENLEATDDDLDAFFREQAEGSDQITAEQIKQYYSQMRGMMDQVRQQVLSRKVIGALKRRFTLDPKTPEEYEALVEAEAEAKAAVSPIAGA